MSSKNQKTLIYISITLFSYILNFMITNPNLWKEFPPKLPTTAFISLYLIPNLLFIALSFEPIETRKKCFTLISLLLLNLSIPLTYRLKYRPIISLLMTANAAILSFKMSLFIKYNRKYLPYTRINQRKEFTSFALSLFNWRQDSYLIPPSKVEPPSLSQIDEKIKSRVLVYIFKLMVYELFLYSFASIPLNISDKPYQIRIIEFVTKGTPPLTANSIFHCICFLGFVFSYLSLGYDTTTILSLIFLRYLTMTQPKDPKNNHHLVELELLNSYQFSSIKDHLIGFTFNTSHCFNNPFMSSNPRAFWSRWQSMYTETFRELGYLPLKNLCVSLGFTRKFCNSMGVFGAFIISAMLHEYFVICLFNVFSGENLCFFMFHSLLLIIWEGIFGYKRQSMVMKEFDKKGDNNNIIINRNDFNFYQWVLLVTINILALPGFIEPLLRRMDRWEIPSFFTDIHQNVAAA